MVIADHTVSRAHIELRVEGTIIEIRDLASSYGVFLDDQRIAPEEWIAVASEETLWLGEVRLSLNLLEATDPEHFRPTVALSRLASFELCIRDEEETITYSIPAIEGRTIGEQQLPQRLREPLCEHLPFQFDHREDGELAFKAGSNGPISIHDEQRFVLRGIELLIRRTTNDWNLASTFLDRTLISVDPASNESITDLDELCGRASAALPSHETATQQPRIPVAQLVETLLLLAAVVVGIFLLVALFRGTP
jgi:hypothetical protein